MVRSEGLADRPEGCGIRPGGGRRQPCWRGPADSLRRPLRRQPQPRFAAAPRLAVVEGQRAAMGFGDLAAQNQADAGAAGLRDEVFEKGETLAGV